MKKLSINYITAIHPIRISPVLHVLICIWVFSSVQFNRTCRFVEQPHREAVKYRTILSQESPRTIFLASQLPLFLPPATFNLLRVSIILSFQEHGISIRIQ